MGKYKKPKEIINYISKMNRFKSTEKRQRIIIGLIGAFNWFGEKEIIEKIDRNTKAIC